MYVFIQMMRKDQAIDFISNELVIKLRRNR